MVSVHGICLLVFGEKPIPVSFVEREFGGVPFGKGEFSGIQRLRHLFRGFCQKNLPLTTLQGGVTILPF